ncbi:HNH endonuclease [Shewanella baltica]|uniref:HNH endonuclease n=1 Tax=Shewanella baltica TaxID=62322 RepID=UPI00325D106D
MIKIQTALKLDNSLLLNTKVEDLYNHLNKKIKNKENKFSVNSINYNVEKLKKQSKSIEYKSKFANDCHLTLKRQVDFYDYLITDGGLKIKEIVTSSPSNFRKIINEVNIILNQTDLYKLNDRGNITGQTKFGSLVSESIFKYKTYRSSKFCINLYQSIGLVNLACPYCNLETISIIQSNNKGKMLLSLDHFYPKSLYPYLALSFYNLIPSCHNCNSNIKQDKNFTTETHINPYLESFNELYTFKLPKITLSTLKAETITIENLNLKPSDKTLSDLEIIGRYENIDLNEVNRLIKTFADYQHYITDGKTDEFKKYIFQMHGVKQFKNEILNTPKSKLLRDIIKSFDVNNALNLD